MPDNTDPQSDSPEPQSGEERAVEGLLRELARGGEGDDEQFVRRVLESVDAPSDRAADRRRRSSRRRGVRGRQSRLLPGLAVAAALLIALGIWFVLHIEPGRSDLLVKRPVPKSVKSARRVEVSDASGLPVPPALSVPQQPAAVAAPPALEQLQREPLESTPKPVQHQEITAQPPALPALPPVPQLTREGEVAEAPGSKLQPSAQDVAPTQNAPETERPIARVAKIVGRVQYARGWKGKWLQAVEGITLLAGDRLETRTGLARIDVSGGTPVYVNRATRLRILRARTGAGEVTLLALARGEVYIEDDAHQIHVETPDGQFVPKGTRFDVYRRQNLTLLTVEQGTVEARAKARERSTPRVPAAKRSGASRRKGGLWGGRWVGGAVQVAAGYQTHVRAGAEPGKPKKTRSLTLLAWLKRLGGPQVLFADNFDASPLHQWPRHWRRHATEAASRSSFVVLQDQGRPEDRFMSGRSDPEGVTQHVFVPLTDWQGDFAVSARIRATGPNNIRAGIQLDQLGSATWITWDYNVRDRRLSAKAYVRHAKKERRSVPLELKLGRWHHWQLLRRGDWLICRIEGKERLRLRFPELHDRIRISLLSQGPDPVHYDDVKVIRLGTQTQGTLRR